MVGLFLPQINLTSPMEKKMTQLDTIEKIRSLVKLPSKSDPWLVKDEFMVVIKHLGLNFPSDVSMKNGANKLFAHMGWQQSKSLLTTKNAGILLQLLENKSKGYTMATAEELEKLNVSINELPVAVDCQSDSLQSAVQTELPFCEKETIDKNFPLTDKEDKERETENKLKLQLMEQYLKSAVRNLDLIEEIHFIKGTLISIRVKE